MAPPVYLDNAATSYPKPEAVYQAVYDYMRLVGASAGRGSYQRALEADEVVYRARVALARLFNVRDAARIVFTANATESLNLAIKGMLGPGNHVVTTSMEHNAVWRCLKVLESERGVAVTAVPSAADGSLDPGLLEEAIRPSTRLIIVNHASNVTGTIMPVREIGEIAYRYDIPLLVDAAQTAGVLAIDVEEEHIDLLAFTGHKGLLGPTGTGGLYILEGINPRPLKEGGTGSESRLERQPDTLPERYEAGTLNVAGLAGLEAGVKFILQEGVERIRAREEELTAYALEVLLGIEGVTIYGPRDPARQVGVISFNLEDTGPEEVGYVLDEMCGIMVRVGLHCAPLAHRTIGTLERGTVRVGLGYFNTREDIDCLAEALRDIITEARGC
ncbi:MAG: aminotransferase class V-fold PLP-dependent enzyme [Clostridia bacterium]|nr:MAG: aminotransferase class V-fold PLP-dependent enzyme [Clostridia bacterium]